MKCNILSGVQKRKRAVEEKEKIHKLPKLTSWLKSDSTSSTNTISSNAASTSTSAPAFTPPVQAYNPRVSVTLPDVEDIPEEESPESIMVTEILTQETDPGLWNYKDTTTVNYWIHTASSSYQNSNSDFSNSCRMYKEAGSESNIKKRYVTKNVFE